MKKDKKCHCRLGCSCEKGCSCRKGKVVKKTVLLLVLTGWAVILWYRIKGCKREEAEQGEFDLPDTEE